MAVFFPAYAEKYSYAFDNTPVSEALVKLARDHADIKIAFIYKELDKYTTSAHISTDDSYEAIRNILGLNPISIIRKDDSYFIEALQSGKFVYNGRVVGSNGEPVVAATVMFLEPRDSTVVTYGVTDGAGRFHIPCDKKTVIAKVSCIGYSTTCHNCNSIDVGTIVVKELPIALHAVSVEAKNTKLDADKTIYIPTQRQKQFSKTGIDLLRHMAISSLVILPESDDVTDVFGNTCELFINHMPASVEDLSGLKITDVRRVEVLDSPSDPRFRGARKAINFIVQEYEYGGYSKALVSETSTSLNGFSNKANVYTKFTYKKMTYDLYAGASNSSSRHSGSEAMSRYTLADGIVARDERMAASKDVSNDYPVTFRASLNANRLQTRNMVSFTHKAIPENYQNGKVKYDNRPDMVYDYRRSSQGRTNSFNYNGSLYWVHTSDFALDYSHSLSFDHRHTSSVYANGALASEIGNNAKENVAHLRCNLYGLKAFGRKHKIKVGGMMVFMTDKVHYIGSRRFDERMKTFSAGASAQYTFSAKRLYFVSLIGCGFERIDVNTNVQNETAPFGDIKVSYMLNDKNRISAYGYASILTPGIGMRQDAVIRNDEFMYLTGNSDLKNYKQLITNVAYNCTPSNNISFAVFAGYDEDFKRIATIYSPYENGKALIRGFVNDGNYINSYIGCSGNLKLLGNNLQLYVNVSQNMYKTTGIYRTTYYPLRIQTQATYNWKSFYLLASWVSKRCSLTGNSNIIIRGTDTYLVEAGWGNGSWVVSLRAQNFFRYKWESQTWERNSPLYAERQTYYSPGSHANINVSVSYTIGYGKKVRQGNEVGAQEEGSSAILKY